MLERPDPPARDPMTYIETLFSVHRGGFAEIADNIIAHLDYRSLVQFKQSSKFVYEYLNQSNLEEHKLRAKLNRDWMTGQPRRWHQEDVQVRNGQLIFVIPNVFMTISQLFKRHFSNYLKATFPTV